MKRNLFLFLLFVSVLGSGGLVAMSKGKKSSAKLDVPSPERVASFLNVAMKEIGSIQKRLDGLTKSVEEFRGKFLTYGERLRERWIKDMNKDLDKMWDRGVFKKDVKGKSFGFVDKKGTLFEIPLKDVYDGDQEYFLNEIGIYEMRFQVHMVHKSGKGSRRVKYFEPEKEIFERIVRRYKDGKLKYRVVSK